MAERDMMIPPQAGIVIGIGMQKGGVAKTTNACHIAVALGELGNRVLLWDVDENYGATKVFGIPPEGFFTTMSVLSGDSTAEDAILAFDDPELDVELPPNVDFIPSSRELRNADKTLSTDDQFYNPNEVLREHIVALQDLNRYDYIIIDTGPHATPTTRSTYMVADYFIISVVPEKQAINSLPDALTDIANARKPGRNPKLHLLGLILSRLDRRISLATAYERKIAERFKQANEQPVKFSVTISSAAEIEKACNVGQTILQFNPLHRVSQQYRDLAAEIVERIAEHRRVTLPLHDNADEKAREVVNA
jgi:chromosome partitioning protein